MVLLKIVDKFKETNHAMWYIEVVNDDNLVVVGCVLELGG